MPLASVLCILALLPLQGAFQEAGIESITLVEGQSLDLDCAVAGGRSSVLEWKNPRWFVIFFKDLRGLRDQRYKLIHYSKDDLHIRLSHVTTDDEGLYTCFRDSVPVKRKQVNVLAMPSRPLVEESRIRVQSREEKLVLKCSVRGSKPPPQITWLLDNGMELFGDTKHQLQGHGKKYNSTSTLTVRKYNQKSAVTCVIHHKSLGGGNLTTSFHLEHVEPTMDFIPTTPEFSMTTLENPQNYTGSDKILNVTEGSSRAETPSPRNEATTLNYSTTRAGSDKILDVTKGRFPTQTPSPNNETATLTPNTTNETDNISNVTEGISHLQTPSMTSKGTTWDSNTTSGSDKILNVTEERFHRQTPAPNNGTATLIPNKTNGTDLGYEEMVTRKPNVLFPVLVSVLLSALFVMVLLFVVKLWKAHKVWKKENEASELEKNRPRTNEDSPGQEKNAAACWKVSKKYVIKGSCTRTSKHSEESQDSSVFEKQLPYVKETDL